MDSGCLKLLGLGLLAVAIVAVGLTATLL